MFSMMVLRMKACPQHSTGKEGVTISLSMLWCVPPLASQYVSADHACWHTAQMHSTMINLTIFNLILRY
ncbi:hypothetical protein C1N96_21105 [Enterobacter hormaechei]|nr:hypothetical protein C1N96_21105 [Enterobacter hormaechei]